MVRPTSPTRRRRPIGRPTALDHLEAAAKGCQAIFTILTLVTPLPLFAVNFMTSRYLAAFGQPGLASLGDVANYSTAILPVVLLVMALIVGFAGLPVLPRWMALGNPDGAFIGAFGWLEPGHPDKLHGLKDYIVAHAPGLTVAGLLIASFLSPRNFAAPHQTLLIWLIPTGVGLICLLAALLRFPAKGEKGGVRRGAQTFVIFLYANFVLITWLVCLASVILATLTRQLDAPSTHARVASLVVAILVGLHLLASAARWEAAIFIVTIMGLALLATPGDRALTALALRYANLGGGLPTTYRPTGKDVAPVRACLVLATGDSRIVWVPKPEKNNDAKPCEWKAFREHLATSPATAAADSRDAALAVRVFKREDLYDKQ